jgi:hypothetical protein
MANNNISHARFNRTLPLRSFKNLLPMAPLLWGLLLCTGCAQDEKEIPPPEIFLSNGEDGLEAEVGDTILIEPKITYDYNSIYEWRKNQETLDYDSLNLQYIATELGSFEYFFKVTTPSGADSVTIPLDVLVMADFQDLTLEEDSFWIGSSNSSGFSNQNIWNPNIIDGLDSWWGFGYSNIFSKASSLPIELYGVYATESEDDIFALVRQTSQTNLPTLTFDDNKNHEIKSLEIANTTFGHYQMKYGTDDFTRLGGPSGTNPDWCKVTITGLDTNNIITGQIEFYLADYRFDNNKKDYIIDEWQVIKLIQIGEVSQLQFNITSSITDEQQHMITPEFFCIDNLKILN